MNENEKVKTAEDNAWSKDNPDWIWAVLLLAIFGFGGSENPRISELEKKVARLEGQMSVIGGEGL